MAKFSVEIMRHSGSVLAAKKHILTLDSIVVISPVLYGLHTLVKVIHQQTGSV